MMRAVVMNDWNFSTNNRPDYFRKPSDVSDEFGLRLLLYRLVRFIGISLLYFIFFFCFHSLQLGNCLFNTNLPWKIGNVNTFSPNNKKKLYPTLKRNMRKQGFESKLECDRYGRNITFHWSDINIFWFIMLMCVAAYIYANSIEQTRICILVREKITIRKFLHSMDVNVSPDDIWMAEFIWMWVCAALPLFEIKARCVAWLWIEWGDWNVFDVIATVL